MAAEVLDGKRIAKEIQAEIKERVDRFVEEDQAPPTLAAVLVGDDPASQVYVRNKERACQRASDSCSDLLLAAATCRARCASSHAC